MHIKKTRLLTPGPTPLLPKALHAMLGADMHHRTQDFKNVFISVLSDLKLVMGTASDVLVLVASGTGAMEASVSNLTSPGAPDSPYAAFRLALAKVIRDAYDGPMAMFAGTSDAVARVIENAIAAERPRARYRITAVARIMIGLRRLLPDRAFDAFLRTQLKPPA